jgi:ankyrin repeat protein
VLHLAARSGMTGICGLLIDRGLDINARGAAGATPLQFAVVGAKQETAKYLARRGANVAQQNDSGVSALDMAAAGGDPQFTNDLKQAAATRAQ